MSFAERLKKDFSTRVIVLIPIAIAINIAIGQIVIQLKLPIFLDSIGTVIVAVIAGPWAGALTGVLTNLIMGIITPSWIPYAPVALIIGLVAGFFAKYGFFRAPKATGGLTDPKTILSAWKVLIVGIAVALAAALSSAPITVALGGVSASGTSLITAFMVSTGETLIKAVFVTTFLFEPLDKVLTCLIAWAILQGLSVRFISRFPRAENLRPVKPAASALTEVSTEG